jgi:hypothetical protein
LELARPVVEPTARCENNITPTLTALDLKITSEHYAAPMSCYSLFFWGAGDPRTEPSAATNPGSEAAAFAILPTTTQLLI